MPRDFRDRFEEAFVMKIWDKLDAGDIRAFIYCQKTGAWILGRRGEKHSGLFLKAARNGSLMDMLHCIRGYYSPSDGKIYLYALNVNGMDLKISSSIISVISRKLGLHGKPEVEMIDYAG